MIEYVIGFVNDDDTYQQLTFRGVSEKVAKALANGLNGVYGNVTLTGTASVEIDLAEAGS